MEEIRKLLQQAAQPNAHPKWKDRESLDGEAEGTPAPESDETTWVIEQIQHSFGSREG